MDRPSPAVQDYLKAIYRLGESAEPRGPGHHLPGGRGPGGHHGVGQQHAEEARRHSGYVVQVKRQGVELTDAGRQAALEVIRHHRLLETYLATRLGMPWDEVHREAEVLEHHVSEALADRIAEALGHPERDPHGHPIPTSAGHVATGPGAAPVRAGRRVRAPSSGRVDDHDDALLRFLAERGLVPDARVEVLGARALRRPDLGARGRRPRGRRAAGRRARPCTWNRRRASAWEAAVRDSADRGPRTASRPARRRRALVTRKPTPGRGRGRPRRAVARASRPAAPARRPTPGDDDGGHDRRRRPPPRSGDDGSRHHRRRPRPRREDRPWPPTRAASSTFDQKTLTATAGAVTFTLTNDVARARTTSRSRATACTRAQRHDPGRRRPPT